MARWSTSPKDSPESVAQQMCDAVEAGQVEVLCDERSRTVKAELSRDQELIYPPVQKFWDDALEGRSPSAVARATQRGQQLLPGGLGQQQRGEQASSTPMTRQLARHPCPWPGGHGRCGVPSARGRVTDSRSSAPHVLPSRAFRFSAQRPWAR